MSSTTADYLDLKQELQSAFPPGTEDWLDWLDPNGPGPLMEASGHVLEDCGTAQADLLRLELSPLTCSPAGLSIWEASCGVQNTLPVRQGTTAQRRAQVLSRLREYGPPTISLIQTIINAYLGYADQTQIVVLEASRANVRAANQLIWTGNQNLPCSVRWTVADAPRVSQGGAQLSLQFTNVDASLSFAGLTGPDGRSVIQGVFGPGVMPAVQLYFPQFAGAQIGGTWQLDLNGPAGSVQYAALFVEGLGRFYDWLGDPLDGRGAAMYEWAVVAQPSLLGTGYDLVDALQTVRRLSYARSRGSLILQSTTPAPPPQQYAAIPDDPGSIPDACIPG